MGQDKLKFKGWDWAELAQLIGREYADFESDEAAAEAIKEHLNQAADAACGNGDAHVAANVRKFLLALEKDEWSGYSKPFYRGLRTIEHDGMMLQLVAHFLEYLWT